MKFIKIKTQKIIPPKDDIYLILDKYLPKLRDGDILFITSKVLAIHQGRCMKIDPKIKKENLIYQEADKIIPQKLLLYKNFPLTIKNHTLIPSAGIDESNGNGYYILWPKNIAALIKQIHCHLQKKFKIKNLAVVVTDSHTVPLRYGVLGVSIGFYGIEPLYDYRGKQDIFNKKLKYTTVNIVDALSAMVTLFMGEGNEQIPMVLLRGAEFIKFTNKATFKKLIIPEHKDLYAPLLKMFKRS